MKKITFLFCFVIFQLNAQNCTLRLVSDSAHYVVCGATLAPMEPIVYFADAQNVNVEGLPPGIVATVLGTELTISGTPQQAGSWHYIVNAGICRDPSGYIAYSIVNEFPVFCSAVTENSVTVSFPNIGLVTEGVLYLFVNYGNQSAFFNFLLPSATTSFTIPNLPSGTDISVTALLNESIPICMDGAAVLTCTTSTLGVNENHKNTFHFAPNPVNDLLEISSVDPIGKIVFYDVLGREVQRETIGTTATKLDLSRLASGTYTMKIDSGGNASAYKIIKR